VFYHPTNRWADEQINRLRAGDLLPWRKKLLEEVSFFSKDDFMEVPQFFVHKSQI